MMITTVKRAMVMVTVICGMMSASGAQPLNDDFANRIVLSGAPVAASGTTVDATLETGEPLNRDVVDRSVWWEWRAPHAGWYKVVFNQGAFVPPCAVVRGTVLDQIEFLVDNLKSGGPTAEIEFTARESEVLKFLVMSVDFTGGAGEVGTFEFEVIETEAPVFPPWQYSDLSDGPVSSSAFGGKLVIFNVWATWCGPCLAEIPHMIELQTKYQEQGLTFVGVSFGEDPDLVKKFSASRNPKFNYPVLTNPSSRFWESVNAFPTSYVVSRDNRILQKIVGYRNLEQWTEIIETHLRASLPERPSLEVVRINRDVRFRWRNVAPQSLRLQSQENIGGNAWRDLGPGNALENGARELVVPMSEGQKFFRIVEGLP